MDAQTQETRQLAIGDDMTIYHAEPLKATLFASLGECTTLELDLGQVGEIDTAGLQLLVLAKRESLRQGKRLRLTAHSQAVREMLDFCNMAGYFGDPMVIPAREGA